MFKKENWLVCFDWAVKVSGSVTWSPMVSNRLLVTTKCLRVPPRLSTHPTLTPTKWFEPHLKLLLLDQWNDCNGVFIHLFIYLMKVDSKPHRKWIAVSGDDDGHAYVLRPRSDATDDWSPYEKSVIVSSGGETVGRYQLFHHCPAFFDGHQFHSLYLLLFFSDGNRNLGYRWHGCWWLHWHDHFGLFGQQTLRLHLQTWVTFIERNCLQVIHRLMKRRHLQNFDADWKYTFYKWTTIDSLDLATV